MSETIRGLDLTVAGQTPIIHKTRLPKLYIQGRESVSSDDNQSQNRSRNAPRLCYPCPDNDGCVPHWKYEHTCMAPPKVQNKAMKAKNERKTDITSIQLNYSSQGSSSLPIELRPRSKSEDRPSSEKSVMAYTGFPAKQLSVEERHSPASGESRCASSVRSTKSAGKSPHRKRSSSSKKKLKRQKAHNHIEQVPIVIPSVSVCDDGKSTDDDEIGLKSDADTGIRSPFHINSPQNSPISSRRNLPSDKRNILPDTFNVGKIPLFAKKSHSFEEKTLKPLPKVQLQEMSTGYLCSRAYEPVPLDKDNEKEIEKDRILKPRKMQSTEFMPSDTLHWNLQNHVQTLVGNMSNTTPDPDQNTDSGQMPSVSLEDGTKPLLSKSLNVPKVNTEEQCPLNNNAQQCISNSNNLISINDPQISATSTTTTPEASHYFVHITPEDCDPISENRQLKSQDADGNHVTENPDNLPHISIDDDYLVGAQNEPASIIKNIKVGTSVTNENTCFIKSNKTGPSYDLSPNCLGDNLAPVGKLSREKDNKDKREFIAVKHDSEYIGVDMYVIEEVKPEMLQSGHGEKRLNILHPPIRSQCSSSSSSNAKYPHFEEHYNEFARKETKHNEILGDSDREVTFMDSEFSELCSTQDQSSDQTSQRHSNYLRRKCRRSKTLHDSQISYSPHSPERSEYSERTTSSGKQRGNSPNKYMRHIFYDHEGIVMPCIDSLRLIHQNRQGAFSKFFSRVRESERKRLGTGFIPRTSDTTPSVQQPSSRDSVKSSPAAFSDSKYPEWNDTDTSTMITTWYCGDGLHERRVLPRVYHSAVSSLLVPHALTAPQSTIWPRHEFQKSACVHGVACSLDSPEPPNTRPVIVYPEVKLKKPVLDELNSKGTGRGHPLSLPPIRRGEDGEIKAIRKLSNARHSRGNRRESSLPEIEQGKEDEKPEINDVLRLVMTEVQEIRWRSEQQMERLSVPRDFKPPRLLLISSKIPWLHTLTKAVRQDTGSVFHIIYDFNEWTFQDIIRTCREELDKYRKGCNAQSIMLMTKGGPGFLYLLKNYVMTPQKMARSRYKCIREFWQSLGQMVTKLNPEESAIHITSGDLTGNLQGRQLIGSIHRLIHPSKIIVEPVPESTDTGFERLKLYFEHDEYQAWRARIESSQEMEENSELWEVWKAIGQGVLERGQGVLERKAVNVKD